MPLLPGVFLAQKKNGTIYYRSSITYRNKHISLGSFDREEIAHLVYCQASKILSSSNWQVEDYPNSGLSLPFEKWVVLLNFRDNGLYLKTPIYLKKNYFFYYYSPELCLKFDIDDLFFYSKHKLMKRGGHLFVSEYGMQTGILGRYGIHRFAVEGRDYYFRNGDSTDFRYSNIVILNPYYGVQKESQRGIPVYTARIHARGTILIGRYSTEKEAAIAYNKAAAILKKRGCPRNFPKNYITELNEIDYASIYHKVRVSKKVREYREC